MYRHPVSFNPVAAIRQIGCVTTRRPVIREESVLNRDDTVELKKLLKSAQNEKASAPRPTELVIEPGGALRFDPRELWQYRELFYFFAWRDIKVRYKQTALGALWAMFAPLVTVVVFTIFFNRVAHIKSPNSIPYAIFSYTGLLFWNFFCNALSSTSNSMVNNRGVITKIYFPRLIAPFSATIVNMVDFGFAFAMYAALFLYYGIAPGLAGVLLLLPMLALTFIAATGMGLFFGALNVRYRDVGFIVPFMVSTLLFLTPVIYPITLVPPRYQWILYLNPMTGIIQAMRAGTLHQGAIPWSMCCISLASVVFTFVFGLFYFLRQERSFADYL
jgi:lipopolysaccharide transport system permease protein